MGSGMGTKQHSQPREHGEYRGGQRDLREVEVRWSATRPDFRRIAALLARRPNEESNAMSNDATRKWANEQHKREKDAERRSGGGYAVCLHCGNTFPVLAGVDTADAAICDVCND